MPSVKASYKYLAFLCLSLLPINCSVEKNTGTTRFYHGLTARYNIYFNGYESFKAGHLKVINGHTDDYGELLQVFENSDPASVSMCSSDMDKAIQKASKLISLKSITARPEIKDKKKSVPAETDLLNRKEYNEWVDDSYLLIGRSRFYKHEFNEAAAVFSYCITEANDPLIRKESSVWLARIYNETGKYIDSYRVLNELDVTDEKSRPLKAMYFTTLADLFIRQKKYSDAIDPLTRSLDLVSGKRTKYRLKYLLAQLNELTGNTARATSLYRDVVKMNPPYDVEFNARINIAGVFDVNSGNPGEIRRELERMLKDSKNQDFHDQIYYALADLSMKGGNEKEALEFFRKSASAPSSNQKIKEAEASGKNTYYSDRFNMGQYYENERRFQGNIEQEGKWYFYNQAALTFGRTEFRRRYGDRKLEDNWRRANKATVSSAQAVSGAEENGQNKTDTAKAVMDYKSPEFYLKNLPLNDTLLAASNERIASAYLNAGKAYAEKIADRGRATESFEALLKRFPANELIPEALYSLYQVNKDSNTPVAESYRQRLLEKYPSTEYAKILSDPDYYEKKLADIKMAGQMYGEAYKAYSTENFTAAISIVDEALDKYSQDMLAPKFLLLRAYSVARTTDERTFRDELNKLIKTWPDSEESKKAGEIIAYLNQKLPELKVEEEKEIAMELFIADTASTHVFALVINDPAFNINLATFDVISYNIDNYTNKNYRTEGTLVDNKYIMITVSG
ncbi:MAG: hypothetical protein H6Q23_2372, partial [Bacteroidetes bacterium]|nr:hypothetical protein [Bacteroidota bacterium]